MFKFSSQPEQSFTEAVIKGAKERFKEAAASLVGMDDVDAVIRSKLESDAPLLEEIPRYLLELGGKRMRPMLCLLVARSLGHAKPAKELIDVAAGIELIHMATLLHDDIIDGSPLRRHQASAFNRFGLGNSLLAGDFLLVRAFSLCALLDDYIIQETERACIELTEGEILETPLWREAHDIESSLRISRKKTAALFRLSGLTAAHLSGLDDDQAAAFGRFGENLGLAFQILDDILDVTADEDLLGKKTGIDLRERKPTAVNVLWLASGSELAKQLLKQADSTDEQFVAEALLELRSNAVIAQCRELAERFTGEALGELQRLQAAGVVKDPLAFAGIEALVAYTTQRLQ